MDSDADFRSREKANDPYHTILALRAEIARLQNALRAMDKELTDINLRAEAAEMEENDLRRALNEAKERADFAEKTFTAENFRAQALESLKRSAEEEVVDLHRRMSFDRQELEELNKRLDAYEKKEQPLLQCVDCKNTESCAGAMARQWHHGRCMHCGGAFKVVRA